LDAGHGGKDRGAVVDGLEEAELNLRLCLRLKELIPELVLLREFDEHVSHVVRASRAVVLGADAIVSIHHNVGKDHETEAQLYFLSSSLPKVFDQPGLVPPPKWISTQSHPHTGAWAFLSRAETCLNRFTKPSCLLEVAFMTDEKFRDRYRQDGGETDAIRISQWLAKCLNPKTV
jgi:N-acetylmuramoyl-L-alanine amidase